MADVLPATLIELFSTFFDRMCSKHPQRDHMIKELYQFKSHLYMNDVGALEMQIETLQQQHQQHQQKSPIRVPKQQPNSQRKEDKENQRVRQSDENVDVINKRLNDMRSLNSKTPTSRLIKNNIISNNSNVLNVSEEHNSNALSSQPTNSLNTTSRVAKAATVITPTPPDPLEELKSKQQQLLKTVTALLNNDEVLVQLLESEETFTKQRQISTGTEVIKNIGFNSRIISQESDQTLRFKKCLKCSKNVENGSLFCLQCRNL